MRKIPLCLLILVLLTLSSPVLSQTCDDVQAAVKAKIDSVQKEYEGKFKDKKAEIDGWQKQLEKETPHPSPAGAAIGFDVETKWTDKEFTFGVPSVTLRDQKIILNLPDITVRQQTWIWNKPVFWVGTTKCGQKPETVCESKRGGPPLYLPGIECYVKWTDIYCDLPQTKLEETKTILGVPEFSMRQQQIIMGIPEFTMQQTKIVLRLPEITVKNVKVEVEKAKERADSFQRQANDSFGTLSAEMRARIETSTLDEMSKVFDCQRTDLRNKETMALGDIDKNIAVVEASLRAANEVSAVDLARQMQDAATKLHAARVQVVTQFADAAKQLDEAQRTAFAGIESGNKAPEPGAKPKVQFKSLRFVQ